MTWIYKEQNFEYNEEDGWYGFVYLIENLTNGKKYVGKKFLHSAATKTIKGKKKKIRKESDWKDYWGSNKELQEDVKSLGEENFKRSILYLFKGRADGSYIETKEILLRDALLDPTYYNNFVGCKIHGNHLKNLKLNNIFQ